LSAEAPRPQPPPLCTVCKRAPQGRVLTGKRPTQSAHATLCPTCRAHAHAVANSRRYNAEAKLAVELLRAFPSDDAARAYIAASPRRRGPSAASAAYVCPGCEAVDEELCADNCSERARRALPTRQRTGRPLAAEALR